MIRMLLWPVTVLLGLAYADIQGYAAANIFAKGAATRAMPGGSSHK